MSRASSHITCSGMAARSIERGSAIKQRHAHAHFHNGSPEPHTHHSLRIGKRPLIIGMVHGLAGSGALMLLVLSTIPAPFVALIYIIVFGMCCSA
jgi:hypothetical protein